MKLKRHDSLVFLGIFMIGLGLHAWLRINSISLIVLPIFVSTLMVWNIEHPTGYLIFSGFLLELFSTQPFGIILLVFAIPLFIHKLRGRTEVDLSFSFTFLIGLSIGFQLLALLAYGWLQIFLTNTEDLFLSASPWLILIPGWITTTIVIAFLSLITQSMWPYDQRNIISLEGHRLL